MPDTSPVLPLRTLPSSQVDLYGTATPPKRLGNVYDDQIFHDAAIDVIEKHDPKVPFFLFHALHLPHTPLQVPKQYLQRTRKHCHDSVRM